MVRVIRRAKKANKYIINNVDMSNNKAQGSIIYGYRVKTFTIENSTMNDNDAHDYITYAYYADNFLVDNTTFTRNNAGQDGGIVGMYRSKSSRVKGCKFTKNVQTMHSDLLIMEGRTKLFCY